LGGDLLLVAPAETLRHAGVQIDEVGMMASGEPVM